MTKRITAILQHYELQLSSIGCSFNNVPTLKVGVEESIVNALLDSMHSKNTNNAANL
jgi:hypothetical protein